MTADRSIPGGIELAPKARAFWARFDSMVGGDASARLYESFHFGDTESLADELAALVVAGTKRAKASLLWSYEAEDKPVPKPGYLSIVEQWSGEPVCIIETTSVAVLPFDQVSPEFAATEGEGDGSLEHWRTGHWAYFGRECARLEKEPSAGMPVVCETFRVVYRALAPEARHHLRIARPVTDLARSVRMYRQALGWQVLGEFADHEGFDGAMLGHATAGYHFEFTTQRAGHVAPAPTAEDLVVLYMPVVAEWHAACRSMVTAGFVEVAPFNPYWATHGRTFADPDGYRVVLQNSTWPHESS
jgi:uncharacterized protein YhfF